MDVAITVSAIRNELGTITGASKIARNITQRKQTEMALLEAKKRAEAADQAKSEFLANMSHEIRTPMNAILGLAHLLGRSSLNMEQQDYATKIATAGRSLLGILNDILDFSKIEAGRMDLDCINFRVPLVFDDLAIIMSTNAERKNIELAIAFDPNIPRWLKGDPSRIQQVLVNLTGNAIKFTERGTVSVRADLEEVRPDATVVRFSVLDTGIGLSPEEISRLFQSFSQADASTTRRFGGTGLGLAISKRLVEMMGGFIGVTSVPGEGSTFWFTIPFELGEAEPDEPERLPLHELTVLVADDSPIARESLSSVIRSLGWQATVVASGVEALEHLQSHAETGHLYDVLLIDWQMPGMDGIETTRRIKEASLSAKSPIVIMVTGYGKDDVLQSPDAAYLDSILVKPITESQLYNTVIEIKAHRQEQTASIRPSQTIDYPRLQGIRILVVEDNSINQEVARKILEAEGASVDIVGDGRQAVEWLRSERDQIDIVVMDTQMPIMDGFEATTLIREELGEKDLPIIALTAGARQLDRDKCLLAGMSDFVAKPLDVDKLILAILRHATPKSSGEAPTAPKVARSYPCSPSVVGAIPGVDLRQALLRLNGDEDLLASMLRRLAETSDGLVDALRQDLESGDSTSAARRMHSLRGGAGNIGVVSIAALASEIEAAILDGRLDVIGPRIEALAAEISAFRDGGVAAVLGIRDDQEVRSAPPLDSRQRDQLVALLRDGNLAALDLYREIASGLKASMAQDRYDSLARALEQMDFNAALAAL